MPSPALFASSLALVRARLFARSATTVVWVQDLYSLGASETQGSGGAVVSALARVESSTLRHADGVAVIHPRFQDRIVSDLGVARERAGVIRNWSSVVELGEPLDRDSVRDRLGWRLDETVLLHAGNMGVKQGLENIIETARLAESTSLPLRFAFTGGGSQKEELAELARGLSNVDFLDSLADGEFEQVLNSADVLLLNEKVGVAEMAVPSKLTTYFSTGLPVIAATDASSISAAEIEASGGGLRVDPGEPAQLLSAIERLRADPKLRSQLGKSGLAFRDTHLAEDAAIDNYIDWLHVLVDQHAQA